MKQICIGILAHVDAGKTTLSEALLYRAGAIRRLGRVDHQDAFLDTDAMERQRGITIFSKQAVLELGETRVTLLDTPGHVDFSAEMERTLQVLDCAVLVIYQVPADGVYEGLVLVDDTAWPAAVNVGLPPTYADDAASAHLEANLIGYTGDLYGASVSLAFTRWLRPSRVFDSLDELIATVEGNIEDIRHNLGEQGVSIRD